MPITPFDKPIIGITMGDPAGIGPEVIVKALSDPEIRDRGRFVIYGMNEQLAYAADRSEIDSPARRRPASHCRKRAMSRWYAATVLADSRHSLRR